MLCYNGNQIYYKNNGKSHVELKLVGHNKLDTDCSVYSYTNGLKYNYDDICFKYIKNMTPKNDNNDNLSHIIQQTIYDKINFSDNEIISLSQIINCINNIHSTYTLAPYSVIVNSCLTTEENIEMDNESMQIVYNNIIKPYNNQFNISNLIN